jgi:hypothetical protein
MKGARIGKPAVEAMPTWAILKRAAKRFPEDELSDQALLLAAVIDAELEREATQAPAEPERSATLRRPTSATAERSSSRSAPFST